MGHYRINYEGNSEHYISNFGNINPNESKNFDLEIVPKLIENY